MVKLDVIKLNNKMNPETASSEEKILEIFSELGAKKGSYAFIRYDDGDTALFEMKDVKVANISPFQNSDQPAFEFEMVIVSGDEFKEYTEFLLFYMLSSYEEIKLASICIGGPIEIIFFETKDLGLKYIDDNNIKNTYIH